VVWTFWVQADGSSLILQLQFSILKIWTVPHITNVGESGGSAWVGYVDETGGRTVLTGGILAEHN